MTGLSETPPRWLRWANTDTARAGTSLVAMVALVGCMLIGLRQQSYINCVAEQQQRDAERTRAIASATDAERSADRDLIAGPTAGGRTSDELRAAAVAAHAVLDRVRAQNPPPPLQRC